MKTRARRGALVALLYVVLGVLLPCWHLAAHRADHDHGAGGLRYSSLSLAAASASSEQHSHAHLAGPHVHPEHVGRPYDAELAPGPRPVRHAAFVDGANEDDYSGGTPHAPGSILHFAGAYLAADGSPLVLFSSLLAAQLSRPASSSLHRVRCSGCPLGARAPPAMSLL